MKNLLEIAKIFVLALLVIIPAKVSAVDSSISITKLDEFVGNWYDSKGNLVLKIGSDYTINGCKVLSVNYNFFNKSVIAFADVTYVVRIDEGKRYRDIYFDDPGVENSNILVIDGKIGLHRNKNISHFESVGGIYLGMWKDEVLKLYGEPSKIENNYGCVTTWKYNNDGFDVKFAADIVMEITIYPYGTRKFDWSGLSARDSISEFKSKYKIPKERSSSLLNIGHEERISYNNDCVTLTYIH